MKALQWKARKEIFQALDEDNFKKEREEPDRSALVGNSLSNKREQASKEDAFKLMLFRKAHQLRLSC